jgi:hypothetical protein
MSNVIGSYVNTPQKPLYQPGDYSVENLVGSSSSDPVGTDTVLLNTSQLRDKLKVAQDKLSMKDTSLFGDENKMGNITGLASTLMQAAALPSQLKAAKLGNEALRMNIDTARSENTRRNNNISGFNSVKPSGNVSAFANIDSNKSSLV